MPTLAESHLAAIGSNLPELAQIMPGDEVIYVSDVCNATLRQAGPDPFDRVGKQGIKYKLVSLQVVSGVKAVVVSRSCDDHCYRWAVYMADMNNVPLLVS